MGLAFFALFSFVRFGLKLFILLQKQKPPRGAVTILCEEKPRSCGRGLASRGFLLESSCPSP